MPEIAKHIAVRQDPAGYSLCIDGEEFPWHITEDGVSTQVSRNGIPSVTLTLVADHVTIGHQLIGGRSKARDHFDPTGRLARAEAARDQAEELLDNAQKALQDNHDTMEQLRAELAKAQAQGSSILLDAARLSLKEAERFEASAEEIERCSSNDCAVGSPDAERVEYLRKLGRDELLLANAQASIAVAEALSAWDQPEPAQRDVASVNGTRVGTAYVEVVPDFSKFDEALERAVERGEQRLGRLSSRDR